MKVFARVEHPDSGIVALTKPRRIVHYYHSASVGGGGWVFQDRLTTGEAFGVGNVQRCIFVLRCRIRSSAMLLREVSVLSNFENLCS